MTTPNPMALKSCPFCGWTGVSLCIGNNFWMECQSITCGAMLTGFKTKEEAISAWNTRAPQTGEGVPNWFMTKDEIEKWRLEEEVMPMGSKDIISRMALEALNALKGDSK